MPRTSPDPPAEKSLVSAVCLDVEVENGEAAQGAAEPSIDAPADIE